jgi:predicted nucleic acid-binding protein
VPGYLLDTNHVAAVFNSKTNARRKLESLADNTQVRVCTITLGEIWAGHGMTITTNQRRRDEYVAFVLERFAPNALEVSVSTGWYYSEIMSRIWKNNQPTTSRKRTEQHLLDLHVDINDVWTVAVAWEHGLIFATQDKMECIRLAVPEVQMESWM